MFQRMMFKKIFSPLSWSLRRLGLSNHAGVSNLTRRRLRNSLLTLVFIFLLWRFVQWEHSRLNGGSFTSGYWLLGSLFFLTAFNLRKKLPMLPAIGSAAGWMQFHIYVGLASIFIFGLHLGWRMPSGYFESFLALLFVLVAGSGIFGLVITRILPKRLNAVSDEVIYERIPWLRREMAIEARQLVAVDCDNSDVLGRYYVNRLAYYLERPSGIWYAIFPNGRQRRQLVLEIEMLDRFLDLEQRKTSRRLIELVKAKDDLDYHAAIQGRLKGWLFIHIGLTYSLLTVACVHGVLAHAFRGS